MKLDENAPPELTAAGGPDQRMDEGGRAMQDGTTIDDVLGVIDRNAYWVKLDLIEQAVRPSSPEQFQALIDALLFRGEIVATESMDADGEAVLFVAPARIVEPAREEILRLLESEGPMERPDLRRRLSDAGFGGAVHPALVRAEHDQAFDVSYVFSKRELLPGPPF